MSEEIVNVAFVGHVDHGKSSILGRLLVDTEALVDGKLERLKAYCATHAKDFEYAYLIDSLEKEQSQGITIDAARYFSRAEGRKFLFIDTPGHLDFIKNMMTGSSTADIALLTIDAKEGIKENTLRHVFILSFLRIHQIFILINKMDQIGYSEAIFTKLSGEILKVFQSHQLLAAHILPMSAKNGDNFIKISPNTPWYRGQPLWQSLCSFSFPKKEKESDFRMPLQDIYRFSKKGDARRIYCGTIISGSLKKGDRILFHPSQKEGVVASMESEQAEPTAGFAIGFTLENQIFVERGELLSKKETTLPIVSNRLKARLFWISSSPILEKAKYTFRIHTSKVGCFIERVLAVYDSATLNKKAIEEAKMYDIAECIICTLKPIAFDFSPLLFETNRFVLLDTFEILCSGVILENVQSSAV